MDHAGDVIEWAWNKSLDRSGGCAICTIMVRRRLNEFAPPGQLNRSMALKSLAAYNLGGG